jgi:hypothetical protein
MSLTKYLICLWLLTLSGFAWSQQQPDCKATDFKIEVVHSTNGENNGEILITSTQSIDPVIHLVSRDKKKSQYNHKSLKITLVGKGEYDLLITDYKGRICPTHKKVTIE